MRSPGPLDYVLLFILCLAWASIYPLVKIAEHDLPGIALMALRAGTATICMLLVAVVTRQSLRVTSSQHFTLAALSVLNVSLIWIAISVAELHLSAGFTSLLTALVPIATFVLQVILRTAAPDPRRILGLLVALGGLALVLDPSNIHARGAVATSLAMMVAGCLGYAAGGLLAAARAKGLHPVVTTSWSLAYATVTLCALSLGLENPLALHPGGAAVGAVVAAGILATAVPNLIFYHLIEAVGPQFASLFGYGVPVFGVLLGILFMHERITTWLAPGMILILVGVWLVRKV